MDFEIENNCIIKYNGNGPDLVIPEGVTCIKNYCTEMHQKYRSITLPASLKKIEHAAFFLCEFESVYAESLEDWLNLECGDATLVYEKLYINGKEPENVVIPKQFKLVRDVAFDGCKTLKRVEIPGATAIDNHAFRNCTQLEEVILSDDVKQIGKSAFRGCTKLKKITLPSKTRKIEAGSFFNSALEEVIIPEGVKVLESSAFENCVGLTNLHIPSSVSAIGGDTFRYCSNLKHVDLSEGLEKIGGGAFSDCKNLEEIIIPSTVKQVLRTSLPSSIKKLTIKCNLGSFDSKAFKYLSPESVYIDESQYEQAKKLMKKAQIYNLDGEPITKAKKSTAGTGSAADSATSLPALKPGEIRITYPADAPAVTQCTDPYVMSGGKPKGYSKPEIKELTVQEGKYLFTITLKIGTKLSSLWKEYYQYKDDNGIYDPKTALSNSFNNTGYTDDKTGTYVSVPLQNNIPEGISPLTADEIEERLTKFVKIVNNCVLQENIEKIVKNVQKKKDGMLYKGRILHLAYLDLVDNSGTTFELVTKNEDALKMSIELRNNIPVTDDLRYQSFLFR